jgi:3',5'-cyclic-AMP phosphodiesterase
MRILRLEERPLSSIVFLNASRAGRPETETLPITIGCVDAMPPGTQALLVTSDLQGVVPDWTSGGRSRLLGEELADTYAKLAGEDLVPLPSSTGVILAGDFYSAPDAAKRGGSGDVRTVWRAFADRFRWVAGVAGNHDEFGTEREEARFSTHPGVHLLDGQLATVDEIAIGGVGGVVGPLSKPRRRDEDDFARIVEQVVRQRPTILVLHEGPHGADRQRGNARMTDVLKGSGVPLTICGHHHWNEPLCEIGPGQQVLNVDARAVILLSQPHQTP